MFEIKEKRHGIKIGRFYYTEEDFKLDTCYDMVMVHGKKRISGKNVNERIQNTLISDLTSDKPTLMQQINKSYRYEIRRAEKEGVYCQVYNCSERTPELDKIITEFKECYNQLFESKGLEGKFNKLLVNALIDVKKITITTASFNGEVLCYHAYIQDTTSTELMYSVSRRNQDNEDRNLIGRANKYLHWKDFEYFKDQGYTTYDWGGIGNIESPSGIAQFKIAFGGYNAEKISYVIGQTFIGKLALKVKNILERKK